MKIALLITAGVLYGLTALLLMGAVLLQESKGGGLAALGGTRAESAFGASNPLRRMTVVLSIIFFLLAAVLSLAIPQPRSRMGEGGGAAVGEEKEKKEKKGTVMEVPITGGEKKEKAPGKSPPAGEKEKPAGEKGAPEPAEGEKPAGS